jgi:hypothetical protein
MSRHDVVRGPAQKKFSPREKAELVAREVKRRLIAQGIMSDPSKREPKFEFHWQTASGQIGGIEKANTKGEARARIKASLGVKTMPAGIQIVRITPGANQ